MFVELHIIQNFAPSNLNRDDTNSPKDCTFGGARRARISSQCIKRSIRQSPVFKQTVNQRVGVRTKLVHERMVEQLGERGRSAADALPRVQRALEAVGFKWDGDRTAVLLFVSDAEIRTWTDVVEKHWDALAPAASSPADLPAENERKKPKSRKAEKAEKAENLDDLVRDLSAAMRRTTVDAMDVALFGRMVAERTDMNVDAACQVAHAISTHAVQLEMDFFTAVDDRQPRSDTGAGMMGVVEFNSACFYRYALVDVSQLIKNIGQDERLVGDTVLAFCKAAVSAIPTGKQNSFAAQNPPDWVRLEVRTEGVPRSLVNAFAEPVRPGRDGQDIIALSIKKAEAYAGRMATMLDDGPARLVGVASTYDGATSLPKLWEQLERALVPNGAP